MAPLHSQGCEGAACPCLDTRLQPPEKTITNWFLFLFPPAVSLHRLPPKILPFRVQGWRPQFPPLPWPQGRHLSLPPKRAARAGGQGRPGGQGGPGGLLCPVLPCPALRPGGGQGGARGGQGGARGARGGAGGARGGARGAREGQGGPGGARGGREGQGGPRGSGGAGGTLSTEIGRVAPGRRAGGAVVLGPGGGRGGARGCQRKCPPQPWWSGLGCSNL